MPLNYNIRWSDPTLPGKADFTILESTLDDRTSITLTGHSIPNYGQIQQTNFVRLLENFASPRPPARATMGQLWYDTAAVALKVNTGATWQTVGPLPDPTDNAGKVLGTDGSTLSWVTASAGGTSLPSQAGNSGKVLTTNGTLASWETVSAGQAPYVLPVASGSVLGGIKLGSTLIADSTGAVDVSVLPVSHGGTGQTTTQGLINSVLPDQTNNAGKFLMAGGFGAVWGDPLAMVAKSMNPTGFIKLPGGLIIQWTSVSFPDVPSGEPGVTGIATFATAFNNAIFGVLATTKFAGSNSQWNASVGATTLGSPGDYVDPDFIGPVQNVVIPATAEWQVQEWTSANNPGSLFLVAFGH